VVSWQWIQILIWLLGTLWHLSLMSRQAIKWQSLWSHNYITRTNVHIQETDTFIGRLLSQSPWRCSVWVSTICLPLWIQKHTGLLTHDSVQAHKSCDFGSWAFPVFQPKNFVNVTYVGLILSHSSWHFT
jgi:hypothetical protein